MCKIKKQGYKPYDQVMINPRIGIGALVDVAHVANVNLGSKFWEITSCAMKLMKQKVMGKKILAIIYRWIEFPSLGICLLLEYS